MNKEELFLENRILELANKCYHKNIYIYSDFLNLNEQNILNNMISMLPPVDFELIGGNIYAERKIIAFKPKEVFYSEDAPIVILKIVPANIKFSERLNHRDYLGAILNLGIDRSKIGDILVDTNCAYIYVHSMIGEYITKNLTKVKHTIVCCSVFPMKEINILPNFQEVTGTINNIRLDSTIALAFPLSRTRCTEFISQGKVFVNGKLITSNGYALKENDIVSVRGLGKFIYKECKGVTKKGRNLITLMKYI